MQYAMKIIHRCFKGWGSDTVSLLPIWNFRFSGHIYSLYYTILFRSINFLYNDKENSSMLSTTGQGLASCDMNEWSSIAQIGISRPGNHVAFCETDFDWRIAHDSTHMIVPSPPASISWIGPFMVS